MRLTKKQWLMVAAVAAVALWLILRKKTAAGAGTQAGHVLDPSNSQALSADFDQLNPSVPGTGGSGTV